jgi:hypothetical protein
MQWTQRHSCSVPAALLPAAAHVSKGQHPAPRQQRQPRDLLRSPCRTACSLQGASSRSGPDYATAASSGHSSSPSRAVTSTPPHCALQMMSCCPSQTKWNAPQTDLEVGVQALAVGAVGHQQRRRRPTQRQPLPVDHRQRHLQQRQNANSSLRVQESAAVVLTAAP